MKFINKFSYKLLITNLFIILLLLSSILYYFYVFIKENQEVQFEQALQTLNIKLAEQVDILLFDMDKTALQIASNPYILSTFTTLPKYPQNNTFYPQRNFFASNSFARYEVRDFLNSFNLKNHLLTRICLYDNYRNFVDTGYKTTDAYAIDTFWTSRDFKELLLYFENDSTESLFIYPRIDPFTLKTTYSDPLYFLSIVRPIKDYKSMNTAIQGYVEIQLAYHSLDNLFNTLDSSITPVIIDTNSTIIYPLDFNSSFITDNLDNLNDYLISSSPLFQENCRVILIQNKDFFLSRYTELKNMIIFIFVIVFIVIAVTQILLVRYFTKPLSTLQKSVESINLANLSLQLFDPKDQTDEFSQLHNAFNKMLEHLDISINHAILSKTSELKSHLFALQAQINPHFIHNVLTVMSVIAEENNVPKLETMCNQLSSMLRFSSSYKQTHCSLQEELVYTEHYLHLMQERYENMFTFTINKHLDTLAVNVPKLIIQPLTENCFKHAFKTKPIPWHINIHSSIKNNFWVINISDNGIGFSSEFLTQFNDELYSLDLSHTDELLSQLEIGGLSLINIYLRLKILYKEQLIFTLKNNSPEGATIILGGPINDN